jgi:hypothetical protein
MEQNIVLEMLVKVLLQSVENNGPEKPVTLGHLLNITSLTLDAVRKQQKLNEQKEFQQEHYARINIEEKNFNKGML